MAGNLALSLEQEREARRAIELELEAKNQELLQANRALTLKAEELSAKTLQLQAILDRTLAAILVVTGEGLIERVNSVAITSFGLSPDTVYETPLMMLFGRNCQATIETLIEHGSCDGDEGYQTVEVTAVRTDKSTFPMEVAVAKLEQGPDEHTVWICRDITLQRKDEQRRRAMETELRQSQKLEALGTLASGVAHEINTPVQFIGDNLRFLNDSFHELGNMLATIRSVVELSNAGDKADIITAFGQAESDADIEYLRDEVPKCIEQSLEGVQRITEIVGAIRSFAHPGNDEKSRIDVNKIVETTITVTRNQWKYSAEMALELDPNLPDILAHPNDLHQVLLNLIVNAADAIQTLNNKRMGQIAISTTREPNFVNITVKDTGCGIPPEIIDRVFDPFFTTKTVGKGTGQGLSIVYNIVVQNLSGTIDIDSTPGEGTNFIIRLPINDTIESAAQ